MSISEQVKELREIAKNFSEWEYNRFYDTISRAADTIESLSAKLADMEQSAEDCGGGWIECENKMPEIGKPVLVCDKQGNVCVRAITCEIKGKKYWSQDKYDVVAWQPLPEPYHES
jgi:hypothetical protein